MTKGKMYLSSISSRLLLYDVNNWDLKKSYGCYGGLLRDITWSDDAKYMIQVNAVGAIEILSSSDFEVQSLQHIPVKDTWSASFHRDGHRNIAIGTKSGNVMIWDTKNKTIIKTFPTPPYQSNVNFISYNAKNTSLAATTQNGDTVIYGLVSNIPVLTVKLQCSKSISAMKFHHESRSLLGLTTDEGHIILRDIATNKDRAYFENVHASPVSDFAYSLVNKDVMLSSGYDKIMRVFDIRLQNVVSTTRTTYTLTSLAINQDNYVAMGTKIGVVLIYDCRDLTTPLKIVKGHEEEVRKVSFQPIKKKGLSTEISLREEIDNLSPYKTRSPTKTRNSDMYFISDSPPKSNLDISNQGGESKGDSFLIMMGLDKSNMDFDDEVNKSNGFEKRSDRHDIKYRQLEVENLLNKVSTPMNSTNVENLVFPSPIGVLNGIPDDGRNSNVNPSNNIQPSSSNLGNINNKVTEDLKDFMKLTIANVADDNRNYFLHVMMALTKQKLFLEKQLSGMNEQIQALVHNQNGLVETNRQLALEIDQLKAQLKL